MNSEYLLDAMGLLDDDLIAEAEEPLTAQTPAPVLWFRRWGGSIAACLAVAALGWVFTHIGMGGGGASGGASSTGGASSAGEGAPAYSTGAASGGAASSWDGALSGDRTEEAVPPAGNPQEPGGGSEAPGDVSSPGTAPSAPAGGEGPSTGAGTGSLPGEVPSGSIFTEDSSGGTGVYTPARYVDLLPEGAVPAGTLSLAETASGGGPSTDVAEYAGRFLWRSADGSQVFVELPEGGFAEADLVQP